MMTRALRYRSRASLRGAPMFRDGSREPPPTSTAAGLSLPPFPESSSSTMRLIGISEKQTNAMKVWESVKSQSQILMV